jgi:hypothetical protein
VCQRSFYFLWIPSWRYSLDSDSVWARCCHRKVMGSNPGRGSVSQLAVQYIYLYFL